jgi:predicted protein tyrosine phosphatase
MISVHVYPEAALHNQNLLDTFVISIVSPGRQHPKMEGSNIHKFQFHDITQEYFLEKQNMIIRPMEKEIAEQIVELAIKNMKDDRWIIHCEAGISRSPGVAIGLSRFIKLRPNRRMLKKAFPMYNKHVCRLIEEAMEKRMKDIDKELLSPGCDGWEDF